MAATEQHVVACMRVADLPKPYVKSRKRTCRRCGQKVWLAYSTPAEQGPPWCMQCCTAYADAGGPCVAEKPNAAQIADIVGYMRRREAN